MSKLSKIVKIENEMNPLWRTIKVYKDLPSSRSLILHGLLEKHLFTSPRCLHLQEYAWSHSQSWSRPSPWSSIKKKMGFHSNPKWLRDECSKNSTHLFILENPKKKNAWRFEWIFLESKQHLKREGNEEYKNRLLQSLISINGKFSF